MNRGRKATKLWSIFTVIIVAQFVKFLSYIFLGFGNEKFRKSNACSFGLTSGWILIRTY
jgi:hypothetical protein